MQYRCVQRTAIVGFIYQRYWPISGLITILGYGVATTTPLCLVGDFDSQVRQLMMNEMLTRAEIMNLSTVFHDLEATFQTRWPGSEVLPLGSFVTGLGSKSSDADCMVTVPRHDVTTDRLLVVEAARLLEQQPGIYGHVRPKVHESRRIALLKFTYIPTNRNCDVNFIRNTAYHNSQMMGYYFSLDDKFLSLAAILKYWAKVQGLRSTNSITSFSLNLLIIFYLQQEGIAPPFILLQRHLGRCPVDYWETSFNRIPYNRTSTVALYQLLGGFFKYYSEFNFDEYIVSPLLGRPIRKREFQDIDSLPEELSLYKSYMTTPNSRPLALNTKLCVQDAIEQRRNTADVAVDQANTLIAHLRLAATMFDVLPSEAFLRVLLVKHLGKQYDSKRVISDVRLLRDCGNATELHYYCNKL